MKKASVLLICVCLLAGGLRAGTKRNGSPMAGVVSFPNPLVFPSTPVGGISTIRNATFYSTGKIPLYISRFDVPPDFAIVQNTCVAYVPVGKSCTISLVFRPTASGSMGEYLYLAGNMNYIYVQALLGNGL